MRTTVTDELSHHKPWTPLRPESRVEILFWSPDSAINDKDQNRINYFCLIPDEQILNSQQSVLKR